MSWIKEVDEAAASGEIAALYAELLLSPRQHSAVPARSSQVQHDGKY